MRSYQLLASLYLAQAAIAAPILLVAGSSAKAVFVRPPHHQMNVVEKNQIVLQSQHHYAQPSKAVDLPAASTLDSNGPVTTEDLMALSKLPTHQTKENSAFISLQQIKAQAAKMKVSVGTLVVPGSKGKAVVAHLSDITPTRPYLIPGYYVASQRVDLAVVGVVLCFMLAIVVVESWASVSRTYVDKPLIFTHMRNVSIYTNWIISSIAWMFQRQGAIRLDDQPINMEDDDDEDMDAAPFGSTTYYSQGLRLPEKVDEKANLI